eukprot:6187880-Pleurochrysis_carterae.AAC.6
MPCFLRSASRVPMWRALKAARLQWRVRVEYGDAHSSHTFKPHSYSQPQCTRPPPHDNSRRVA